MSGNVGSSIYRGPRTIEEMEAIQQSTNVVAKADISASIIG
jgi:hypothetical protein